jgi:transcriptional regulator with XRE-family HTH domain
LKEASVVENNFVGLRIRKLRKCAGASQTALGTCVGKNQVFVSLIERGVRTPTAEEVDRLLKAIESLSDEDGILQEETEKAKQRAIARIRTRQEAAGPRIAVLQVARDVG